MNWLKRLAPWIGAAATGNVPALIGMAAQEVGKAIGKDVKPDIESILAAVAGATPEQILAIKQADNDVMVKMQALGFQTWEDVLKIDAADRASARAREMAVKDKMPIILGILAVAALVFCICLIAFVDMPTGAKEAILTLIGFVGASYKDVYGYYFGSSAGSQAKNELLAKK